MLRVFVSVCMYVVCARFFAELQRIRERCRPGRGLRARRARRAPLRGPPRAAVWGVGADTVEPRCHECACFAGAAGAARKRENREWPVDGVSFSPLLAAVRHAMRVRACVERTACAAHDARAFSVFLACLSVRTRYRKPRCAREWALRAACRLGRKNICRTAGGCENAFW